VYHSTGVVDSRISTFNTSAEWVLRSFDRFVAQTFEGRRPIDLKVAIEGWLATLHGRPVTITNNFLVLRKFCLFLPWRIVAGDGEPVQLPERSATANIRSPPLRSAEGYGRRAL
jgi:hypothetical protein